MSPGGLDPTFTPHIRRGKGGENSQHNNNNPPRPETSRGRRRPMGGEEEGGNRRSGRQPHDEDSGAGGLAKPREFTRDFSKKVQQGRKERDQGPSLLEFAQQSQGRQGHGGRGGDGGRGRDRGGRGNNSQPGRRGKGLLDDRQLIVLSSGGRPPVDLSKRPTHPPGAKKMRHDLDDSTTAAQGVARHHEQGQSRPRQPRRQQAFGRWAGGGLSGMFDSAPKDNDWDHHGHQHGAPSLDAPSDNNGGSMVARPLAEGSSKDNAISLCDDDNSETEEEDRARQEPSNKRRKSEGEPRPPLATKSGTPAVAARPTDPRLRLATKSGTPAVTARPTDPRLRLRNTSAGTSPAQAEQGENSSALGEFTTPRPGGENDKGSKLAVGKDTSGAETNKTILSLSGSRASSSSAATGVSSSRSEGEDCSKQRASQHDDVPNKKRALNGGNMNDPIPRKQSRRVDFSQYPDETSDSISEASDDSAGRKYYAARKASEDSGARTISMIEAARSEVSWLPVSHCHGPPSTSRLDDPSQVAARKYHPPRLIASALNTATDMAKGVLLNLSKQNTVKPGSSRGKPSGKPSGKPIHPGLSLMSQSQNASKPLVAESGTAGVRSAKRSRPEYGAGDSKDGASGVNRYQTRAQSRSKQREEIIELDDDDDDDDDDNARGSVSAKATGGDKLELDVLKIAIGKAVHSTSCRITFDNVNDRYELAFVRAPRSNRETRSACFFKGADITRRAFSADDVLEVRFHKVASRKQEAMLRSDDNEDVDDSQQLMSFISILLKVDTSDFRLEKKDLAPTSRDDTLRYVVVEFRNDDELQQCIHHLSRKEIWELMLRDLSEDECANYAKTLTLHYKNEAKSRQLSLTSPSSKRRGDGFLADKDVDDILLVYPFNGDTTEIEAAAEGLTEAKGVEGPASASAKPIGDALANDSVKFAGRGHYMTVRVGDYQRLEPTEYLNDTLIDFWMQWFTRHADRSKIHLFSSHFYTTLKENRPEDVTKWTKNKGINVFEKQLIFIPVNQTLHWSLCVIANPGAIANNHKKERVESDLWSGIYFFDSLKAHGMGQITKNVRGWLNSECKRLYDSNQSALPPEVVSLLEEPSENYEANWRSFPFAATKMGKKSPKVPYQDNGWDCGVFVCRYAYAMYELARRTPITREFVGSSDLTESDEFCFSMRDIARVREEMKTLLRRLTKVYASWKEEELRRERDEETGRKAAAKQRAKRTEGDSGPESSFGLDGGQQGPVVAEPRQEEASVAGSKDDTVSHPATPSRGNVSSRKLSPLHEKAAGVSSHSDRLTLRHPGDPTVALAIIPSGMNSIGNSTAGELPLPSAAGLEAKADEPGSVVSGTVLKDDDCEQRDAVADELESAVSGTVLKDVENQNLLEKGSPQPTHRSSKEFNQRNALALSVASKGDSADLTLTNSMRVERRLRIDSSSSSESSHGATEDDDNGHGDAPVSVVESAEGDGEAEPDDLCPIPSTCSASALASTADSVEKLESVHLGVALMTTKDDSTMETVHSDSDQMDIPSDVV